MKFRSKSGQSSVPIYQKGPSLSSTSWLGSEAFSRVATLEAGAGEGGWEMPSQVPDTVQDDHLSCPDSSLQGTTLSFHVSRELQDPVNTSQKFFHSSCSSQRSSETHWQLRPHPAYGFPGCLQMPAMPHPRTCWLYFHTISLSTSIEHLITPPPTHCQVN